MNPNLRKLGNAAALVMLLFMLACSSSPELGTGCAEGSTESCAAPPVAYCKDRNTRVTFAASGTCNKLGQCVYAATEETCAQPPAPTCADGSTRRTYPALGTCSEGVCVYEPKDEPCDKPPKADCKDLVTERSFAARGTCNAGVCAYAATEKPCAPAACTGGVATAASTCKADTGRCNPTPATQQCGANGCRGAYCEGDPCVTKQCNAPPSKTCKDTTTEVTYSGAGVCSRDAATNQAKCEYARTEEPCTRPPAATCKDGTTRRTFNENGTCSGTSCSYTPVDTPCTTPNPPTCANGTTRRTFSSAGTCASGVCAYSPIDAACPANNVCQNGACVCVSTLPDTCTGQCVNKQTDRNNCGACGTVCPAAQTCTNGACVCSSTALTTCGQTCVDTQNDRTNCGACGTVCPAAQTCTNGSCACPTSGAPDLCGTVCVNKQTDRTNCGSCSRACAAGEDCVSGRCLRELTATTASMPGPGLNDCGPAGNDVCARSLLVSGGTFYRGTTTSYPATISDFRLDKYEVTVGRFRKFVEAWTAPTTPWRPSAGAGKHTHLNTGAGLANTAGGREAGWDATWTAYVGAPYNFAVAPTGAGATTKANWDTNLDCDDTYPYQTWTSAAGSNETRPQNCLSWYDLYAFCIWDGGFLPSEAEWEYAAAGGSDERAYPWGPTVPGTNTNLAIYGCYYSGTGSCSGVTNIAPVGTVATGASKAGQLDMAGNVVEWSLDWWQSSFATPCNNCTNLTPGPTRVNRGGSFYSSSLSSLSAAQRTAAFPASRETVTGGRCARIP